MDKDIVKKILYVVLVFLIILVLYKAVSIFKNNNEPPIINNPTPIYTEPTYTSNVYTEEVYTENIYTEDVYTESYKDKMYNVSYFFYDVSNGKSLIKSYNTQVKGGEYVKKDTLDGYENFEYYLDGDFKERLGTKEVNSNILVYVKCTKIYVAPPVKTGVETIKWNSSWEFASFSQLHNDSVKIYYPDSTTNRKNITVTVNAGHGSPKGGKVYVYCHPDKSPKLVSGSTAAGETKAKGVSSGTTLKGGVSESQANLNLAMILKRLLLEDGYNVLMIRENNDSELDNVARTVYSNNNSDCQIALHYDSSDNNKGAFYVKVPQKSSYLNMYPVSKYWQQHDLLGENLIKGIGNRGIKLRSSGPMSIDYVQTSYSTQPSVLIEVGDKASDLGTSTQTKIAMGIVDGVNSFFHK